MSSFVALAGSLVFTVASASILSGADEEAAPALTSEEQLRRMEERQERADARIQALEEELARTRAEGESPPALGDATSGARVEADAPPAAEAGGGVEGGRDLGAEIDSLREEVDGLQFVIPGTSRATVVFNGRIHGDFWGFPGTDDATAELEGENPQDRFGFRRVRFGAKGDVADFVVYKVEIEFANPDDFEWRDVYIGLKNVPWIQSILVGNQKRPYGLDHLNSSRYNVFLERPMFIDAFNDDARRLGIAVYGTTDDAAWNWRLGLYNGDKAQDSDSFYTSDHMQGEVSARIANTPWYPEESEGREYFHWGLSGAFAKPDDDGDPVSNTARFRARPEARSDERWINTDYIAGARHYELVGLESVLNLGPVQLVGEYQNVFTQRRQGPDLHFWGAYGYVSWFITGEHMPWSRKTGTLGRIKPKRNFFVVDRVLGEEGCGWGAWQVALRYSYSDMSSKDVLGGVGQNVTFGLNWYWNPNARLQFNYIHGWIDDSATLAAVALDRAEYDIVGTRLCIDF